MNKAVFKHRDIPKLVLWLGLILFTAGGAALNNHWGLGVVKGGSLYLAALMTIGGLIAISSLIASAFYPRLSNVMPWKMSLPYLAGTLVAFGVWGVWVSLAPASEFNERTLFVAIPIAVAIGAIGHTCCRIGRRKADREVRN